MRKQSLPDRDFRELRDWLDHQYQPGRLWAFRRTPQGRGPRSVLGYALLFSGGLMIVGALLLTITALLSAQLAASLSAIIFLAFMGVFQVSLGLLGRRSARAARRPRSKR